MHMEQIYNENEKTRVVMDSIKLDIIIVTIVTLE